jgi:hypothetical protein
LAKTEWTFCAGTVSLSIFLVIAEQLFCNCARGPAASTEEARMFNKKLVSGGLLATTLILGLAGPVPNATAGDNFEFSREVDSCVAAVTSRLDLGRATRVRHLVSNAKRTGIGYVLTIETAVFFDTSEKNYEAYCVANGDSVPLKFHIEEIDL